MVYMRIHATQQQHGIVSLIHMYCLNLIYSLVYVVVRDTVHYCSCFLYWFIKFWDFDFCPITNPHY